MEGWGWSEQSGLTTMHGGTRATRTDALTDMHTCVWMFTKTLIPAFLFSPSKRPQGAAVKASHARTHARTHACMSACNVFFLHSYYVSIYVSLRRFLVPAQFLWKIFPSITATKGIAAIKGSSEPTDPHGAEKGHFGW